MDNDKSKSQSFIELLPQIYKRILISKDNYRVICNWLKKEHGLDFFQKSDEDDDSEKTYYLFTNYLRKYGNVKKAREHYTENVNTNIEESWWKDFVDENNKPIGVENASKPSNISDIPKPNPKEHIDNKASTNQVTEKKPSAKVDHTSLSEALGIKSKKAAIIDYDNIDPYGGFDGKPVIELKD